MKILLVNPIIRAKDKPRHVPFGIAQIASVIIGKGHKVQVFDCNAWRPTDNQIKAVLKADDWDIVAIGGLVTSYGFIKSFVKKARQNLPRCKIILGGGVVTPIPKDVLRFLPAVDIAIIGEGYITFAETLEAVEDKTVEYSEIKGIAWRNRDGEIIVNETRDFLKEVDSIPFPAWHLFPLDIYFTNSSLLLSEEAMVSRRRLEFCCSYGCPYKCKYCFHLGLSGELDTEGDGFDRDVVITNKRKVRWHSPEYVVELSKYAKDKFGADFISFLDENFVALDRFTHGKWMDAFENLWIKAGLQPRCIRQGVSHRPSSCEGVHWGTTCHPALADIELLKRLKKIGCSYLDFGFESFSNEVLKEAGKGATKKMNIVALKACLAADIRAIPNQIIGFPNESFDSILENLEVWEELGIKAYPFLATPYPGSEWYFTYKNSILEQYDNDLEKFLLDLGDATKLSAVISRKFNAVELLGLRELMANYDTKRIIEYEKIWRKRY